MVPRDSSGSSLMSTRRFTFAVYGARVLLVQSGDPTTTCEASCRKRPDVESTPQYWGPWVNAGASTPSRRSEPPMRAVPTEAFLAVDICMEELRCCRSRKRVERTVLHPFG